MKKQDFKPLKKQNNTDYSQKRQQETNFKDKEQINRRMEI